MLGSGSSGSLTLKLEPPAAMFCPDREVPLADPRSTAIVDNFAGQWLQLRNLASAEPDLLTFPDFDDNLREGFRTETSLFFERMYRNGRPRAGSGQITCRKIVGYAKNGRACRSLDRDPQLPCDPIRSWAPITHMQHR